MDYRRFDILAKTLARATPRRGLLRLAALALAGFGSPAGESEAGGGPGGRPGGKRHGRNRGHHPGNGKANRRGRRPGHRRPPAGEPAYVDCADPANHGKPCGKSAHPRGGTLRCCGGTCPDRDCIPTGFTGVRCATNGDCGNGYDCCSTYGSCVAGENECECAWSEPGTDCGSDVDCAYVGQICVCGGCV